MSEIGFATIVQILQMEVHSEFIQITLIPCTPFNPYNETLYAYLNTFEAQIAFFMAGIKDIDFGELLGQTVQYDLRNNLLKITIQDKRILIAGLDIEKNI